jgi:DNA-directed RNA polymerase subunit alpha
MRVTELHRPQAVVLDSDRSEEKHGTFVAQPFERGWGLTVGNAMRRILLSSVEGSAIVAVRIAGVSHEYDSVPGVMEDVTDLILNLKRVPLILHDREETTVALKASGPGTVTSEAISGGSELDVVDRGVYLATLSEEGSVDAELVVRRGRGYVPADDQPTADRGVGFIFVDAAFSPVRRANYRIEPARVGQATDFEKLTLDVWTNGTITPTAAVAEAASLLADHLPIFSSLGEPAAVERRSEESSSLSLALEDLGLGGRVLNMLRNAGIATVRDLVAYSEDELRNVPGFGPKALSEVQAELETRGLSLGMRFDLPGMRGGR